MNETGFVGEEEEDVFCFYPLQKPTLTEFRNLTASRDQYFMFLLC